MKKPNLRKEAKGRNCMIRIPGICKIDRETVVLCHLNNKRLFGVGTGQKVPDLFGAWGCRACHDAVDSRNFGICNFDVVKVAFYEGVFRTQNALLKEGWELKK